MEELQNLRVKMLAIIFRQYAFSNSKVDVQLKQPQGQVKEFSRTLLSSQECPRPHPIKIKVSKKSPFRRLLKITLSQMYPSI